MHIIPVKSKATLNSLKLISKKILLQLLNHIDFQDLSSFLSDFIKSLDGSDSIFVLPVYSAGEKKSKEK